MNIITRSKISRTYSEKYRDRTNKSNLFKGILATEDNKKFISLISHNIKNPFGALLGYSELLLDDFNHLSDLEKRLYISEIGNISKFVQNYFERFMEWTYLKMDKFIPSFQKLNLRELIAKSFESAYTNVEFIGEVKIDVDENHKIFCDSQTTLKLFYYIIENALMFVSKNGNVSITSEIENNSLRIDIFNDGLLFNQEDFLLALNPTVHFSTRDNGTGLGVLLANEYAKFNHGKIVLNEDNVESTLISIYLPNN